MIRSAEFVTSLDGARDFPGRGLPEIAVAGRSNVGKSSLINRVCGQKRMARSGGTPGVTQWVNAYNVDSRFFLMDLPGYGYAKADKERQRLWSARVDSYLSGSGHIAAIFHIVDIRHAPGPQDLQMIAWIRARRLPYRIIATKADKISGAARQRLLFDVGRALAAQPWEIIAFSAQTGLGTPEVIAWIEGILAEHS